MATFCGREWRPGAQGQPAHPWPAPVPQPVIVIQLPGRGTQGAGGGLLGREGDRGEGVVAVRSICDGGGQGKIGGMALLTGKGALDQPTPPCLPSKEKGQDLTPATPFLGPTGGPAPHPGPAHALRHHLHTET